MTAELPARTKAFAAAIVQFGKTLPLTKDAVVIKRQLLESGTSPCAHCREAFRSRSDAEKITELETALQELDESLFWMELLIDTETVPAERLEPLMIETNELLALAVAAVQAIQSRE